MTNAICIIIRQGFDTLALNVPLFAGRASAAMAIMIYALLTYHWRASAIRNRGSGPYDDRLGPTVLSVMLLIAVLVNFILRFNA